ncbi:HNH endonuclease [Rhizobium sp. BK376]|uniref:HNH endonuclease n=1 Tax=Rhizobium sp. BK376 TaxID=2512149 RepID=UPI0010455691|nr:HNH endonuclease [Rhizobium sp. BK376]TCR69600.1 HNH endonuclease [Rhizobium sp. BK376]
MIDKRELKIEQLIPEAEFAPLVALFEWAPFSTADFASLMKTERPSWWKEIEDRYGAGGKGAKVRYSAYSFSSQVLNYWSRRGLVDKLEYKTAPETWGSNVVRYWARDRSRIAYMLFPDEVVPGDELFEEGATTQILVNRYERDPVARQRCIDHHKARCSVCELDFEEMYGERGAGFIHVHHRRSLGARGASHKVDPIRDLVPVCPNCHAMLHRKRDELTVEELRAIIGK